MKKLNTNEDLVVDLMNYSPYGALSQAFVMEAIQRYARQVAAAPVEKLETGLVSGAAWQGVAKDILGRCDAFYNRHNQENDDAVE